MKFTSTILTLAALFSVASALTETVRYNTIFDNKDASLNGFACSNGDNGLVAKYPKLGDLPKVAPGGCVVAAGGVFAVSGWGSPECGSCWKLTYNGYTIHVIAVDTNSDGFDISLAGMNSLTGGKAVQLDSIKAQATKVPKTECGL